MTAYSDRIKKQGLYEQKINFLINIETNNSSHSDRTLLDHLIGVHDILKEWGTPEYLQDAGLFHSVYGTTRYLHQSTNDRAAVKEMIGEQAEELVWQFCNLSLPRYDSVLSQFDGQIKDDLILLLKANSHEQNPKQLTPQVVVQVTPIVSRKDTYDL